MGMLCNQSKVNKPSCAQAGAFQQIRECLCNQCARTHRLDAYKIQPDSLQPRRRVRQTDGTLNAAGALVADDANRARRRRRRAGGGQEDGSGDQPPPHGVIAATMCRRRSNTREAGNG